MPMPQRLSYVISETKAGWLGIMCSPVGLLRCTLPQPSAEKTKQMLGASLNYATPAPHLFDDLVQRLRGYFAGQKVTFDNRLDLSDATPFQREVWETAILIPYGETRSYRWVAEHLGKPGAARAVGQALGKNPLPVIVPCHRVLTSDGGLGGYSGGLETKRRLLRTEAAAMPDNPR